jgi:hypothetical protein
MTLIRAAVRRIQRFVSRTPVERRLLVRSYVLLLAITVGLRLVPFISLQRMLSRLARSAGRKQRREQMAPDKIAWAVTGASLYVPGAACLSRALALQVLLEEQGRPAQLHIGIGRGPDRTLQGHAWVEAVGVLDPPGGGADGLRRILTLTALDHSGSPGGQADVRAL